MENSPSSSSSSSSFGARVVNQTISSVLVEWDPVLDADVYKIEQHHKPDIWTRVYWGSKPLAKIDHLDENFCYQFRITALKYDAEQEGYVTLSTSDPIKATTLPTPPTIIHLHRAIKKGQQFLVKRLLSSRPDLIETPAPNGYYPLANAIIFGELDIIDILLTAGASVHRGNDINGASPLHLAFYYGHLTVAKVLLNKKARLDGRDCIRLTPAHYAIIAEQQEMLKFAIENGCDIEAKDICEWTLLLRAVSMGCSLSMIKLLVNSDANIQAVDKKGLTSIDIAEAMKNQGIAIYLRSKI